MPEPKSESRANYTPPILESHPAFTLSIGCSLPAGLGCLPLDSIPDANLLSGG